MKMIDLVHRTTLGIAFIALAVAVLAGCSRSPNPLAPTNAVEAQNAFSTAPDLGPELSAVREATDQFHDVTAAVAAGYVSPAGRPCEQTAIGAMGIHSPNRALQTSQIIDPLRPEVLLYLPKPGSGFRLVGVEYMQFVLVRNPETNQVAPWTSPTPWPSDYEVVTPTPQLFGRTFDGPMAGHVPGMPWHWDLHVWVWAHNPTGLFERYNPALSCI